MFRTFLCGSLLLPLALAVAAHAENRALLVGIGNYKTKEFRMKGGQTKSTSLPGIDLDVNMMHEVALKLGFKESQIRILRDEQASLDGLRQNIQQWLIDGVGPDDHVLFYYSGHGAQIPDQPPLDEDDGLDEVIVTWDFEQIPNGLKQVFVDDEFAVWLKKIPSKNVIIMLDSCNSGTADKSLTSYTKGVRARDMEGDLVPKILLYDVQPNYHKGMGTTTHASFTGKSEETSNYIGLMAAQENEFANATKSGSLLTKAVHEAVMSMGDAITVEQLHQAATQAIVGRSPDIQQHPQLAGNLDHRGIDIRLGNGAPAPASDFFSELERWADNSQQKLTIATDKPSYKVEESMKISLQVSQDGYLNIVNIGEGEGTATVLFPNQTHTDGRVHKGQTIELPNNDKWDMPASLPAGASRQKVLVVAFITQTPRNFYETGFGSDLLRTLNQPQAKEFIVRSKGGYSAGKVVVEIQK
jgi:hypothetical protein